MAEVTLITGCGSGIGKALAQNLHGQKNADGKPAYKVFATDYRVEAMKDLEEEGIATLKLDVTSATDIKSVVDKILATTGHIDLLVCNAGLTAPGFLAEMDYRNVERVFDVNVHGVFRTIQAVVPHMMAQRSGKIATLCSVNSYLVQPFNAPYAGTKAAVAMMTEALAMEVAAFGISVTSVIPGWVRSDILPNSHADFERYERPESFYHTVIHSYKAFREKAKYYGFSTKMAAADIAKGLTKPKPPRFIYTGTWVNQALTYGFIQQWISRAYVAWDLSNKSGLSKLYETLDKLPAANKKAVPLSLQKEE